MNTILLPISALLIAVLLIIIYFSKRNMINEETKIYSRMLWVNLIYAVLAVLTFIYAKTIGNEFVIQLLQKVYMISTFAMFTEGFDAFNKAYEKGLFDALYSTNLTYIDSKVNDYEWYKKVDCANYAADVINTLNTSGSVSDLKNGKEKVLTLLDKKKKGQL